jgi:hypothetical protein
MQQQPRVERIIAALVRYKGARSARRRGQESRINRLLYDLWVIESPGKAPIDKNGKRE